MTERARRPRRGTPIPTSDEGTHRGGFGDLGGATSGLIERTFRERIVLVGVTVPPNHEDDTERSLDELALLIDTAGADEVARVVQRRTTLEPATFIGKGKATELRDLADDLDADTVVFDNELTPAQQFNLEKLLGRSALDRTAVILDIFAQNAHSQEGKAQVELAQLRYRLPRLRGRGTDLSQQGGGIGTRGPGETQLEVDRRRLVRRVHKLEADLRDIGRHRATQRKSQRRSRSSRVAIVGYTNAGKSTLLNQLTDAGVLVEDRLFATLDATTRRLDLPGGEPVLVTDTVGFVRKLPHQLVEAFRSTLDVVVDADLLVHVVDSSAPDPDEQIDAVRTVLAEIDAASVPELLVFNKADANPVEAARLAAVHPGSVAVSARRGDGVDDLLVAVGDRLRAATAVVELAVPFDRGDVLASVHREGEVLVEQAEADGMRLRARLDPAAATRLREFVVPLADGVSSGVIPAEGWTPPPYPYDRLAAIQAVAAGHDGGAVDLSVGTPVDPPPPSVIEAMAAAADARGYPPSVGTPAFREAAAGWMRRRLGVSVDPVHVAACVGTKELVAGVPQWLRLRDPSRDTVLYPAVSYPTYAMGATLAGCRAVPVDVDDRFRLDLSSVDPSDAARALCLWVNAPGNPAGGLDDLGAAAAWGRAHEIPVLSDECYVEFTWTGPRHTILEHGADGVLAVHSLSKRSNLAGARVGFYAGDPDLVTFLAETRKHAGFMVAGPVQAAAVAAWADDTHVDAQRDRYRGRLERMAAVLGAWGLEAPLPDGGFYLWVPAPDGDAWALTERLATEGGVVASPGEFYGPAGARHVRLAMVQPDSALERVAARLGVA